MGQYEHGAVVGRILSPPSAPRLIRPVAADRTEHVAAHDPRAHALSEARCEVVIDAGTAPFLAAHLLEGARRNVPIVQLFAADSERIFAGLIWTGSIAVERDRKVVNADTRHECLRYSNEAWGNEVR